MLYPKKFQTKQSLEIHKIVLNPYCKIPDDIFSAIFSWSPTGDFTTFLSNSWKFWMLWYSWRFHVLNPLSQLFSSMPVLWNISSVVSKPLVTISVLVKNLNFTFINHNIFIYIMFYFNIVGCHLFFVLNFFLRVFLPQL